MNIKILGKPVVISHGKTTRIDLRSILKKNYSIEEFMAIYNYLLNEGFFPYDSSNEIRSIKL